MLWVACPWAGAGACQVVAVPVLGLIPVEQEEEAPCQEEREGAWASEAYLWNTNKSTGVLEEPIIIILVQLTFLVEKTE